MRKISLGHLVVEDGIIGPPEWEYAVNGQAANLTGGMLPDWNYFSDLDVSCNMTLNLPNLRRELHVADDLVLAWVLIARSTSSPVITASAPLPVTSGAQEVAITVPASTLGGVLTLELEMGVLSSSKEEPGDFAPSQVGHTVYRTVSKIVLEGDGGQLPILPVSFKDHGITNPSSSLWWLRVLSQDLHDPAAASLWMWINTDNPQLQPLIDHVDSDAGDLWMQILKMDFIRQLLREALSHAELDESRDYPEGSLGALLLGVVKLVGSSLKEVRSKYGDDPGRVEADLQGVVNGSGS
ncbi:hypothetical protein QEH68_06010 [Paenarthrobacter sp. OM7]|uniref:hypothetical protein n=1 Tax=Paenarthrobacter sp. OM7 TaxID=3041264 RepID=UPI0024690001|nr:hypothetical protein [Paenarthrobacter sp. OM7]WGM21725.1 hypothetical protein QEH68_06010 [Paenarthrobacter sp. OM7]